MSVRLRCFYDRQHAATYAPWIPVLKSAGFSATVLDPPYSRWDGPPDLDIEIMNAADLMHHYGMGLKAWTANVLVITKQGRPRVVISTPPILLSGIPDSTIRDYEEAARRGPLSSYSPYAHLTWTLVCTQAEQEIKRLGGNVSLGFSCETIGVHPDSLRFGSAIEEFIGAFSDLRKRLRDAGIEVMSPEH